MGKASALAAAIKAARLPGLKGLPSGPVMCAPALPLCPAAAAAAAALGDDDDLGDGGGSVACGDDTPPLPLRSRLTPAAPPPPPPVLMLMLPGLNPPPLPPSVRPGLAEGDPPGEAEAEDNALEVPPADTPPCSPALPSPSPPSELARVSPIETMGAAPAASAAHALSRLPLLMLPLPGVWGGLPAPVPPIVLGADAVRDTATDAPLLPATGDEPPAAALAAAALAAAAKASKPTERRGDSSPRELLAPAMPSDPMGDVTPIARPADPEPEAEVPDGLSAWAAAAAAPSGNASSAAEAPVPAAGSAIGMTPRGLVGGEPLTPAPEPVLTPMAAPAEAERIRPGAPPGDTGGGPP